MSTHNICIRREIRKILCGYPLLSVAMQYSVNKGKYGRNLYLKVLSASDSCVQGLRGWLPVLMQLHYFLLNFLCAHLF